MEEFLYKRGDLIGHYQVLEHLGSGGFCATYLGHDLADRDDAGPSALKVCRWLRSTMPHASRLEHNRRLRREFELLHRCNHRNIVRTLEVHQHDALAYYAMEVLGGPTLGLFMGQQRQPLPFLVDILQQVVEGLAYLHRAGIVHRDLKPSNIIITGAGAGAQEREQVIEEEGTQEGYFFLGQPEAPLVSERGPDAKRFPFVPVLIDLGISHDLGGLPLTGPGRLMGTLEYLSPEYCRANLARQTESYAAEPSDDVHTVGILLFEALTGQLPWTTPGPLDEARIPQLLEEIAHGPPRDPREFNSAAPDSLAALAALCLQKHGAKRPPDAGDLLWRFNAAMQEDAYHRMPLLKVVAPEYRGRSETTLESRAAQEQTAESQAPTRPERVEFDGELEASPGLQMEAEALMDLGASGAPSAWSMRSGPMEAPCAGAVATGPQTSAIACGAENRAPEGAAPRPPAGAGAPGQPGAASPGSGDPYRTAARWAYRGAMALFFVTFAVLAVVAHAALDLGEREAELSRREESLTRRAVFVARVEDQLANPGRPVVLGSAQPEAPGAFALDLTALQSPTPWLIEGGRKMTGPAVPGQLKAEGRICAYKGRRLVAAVFFGVCWFATANIYWAMDPPEKDKKCPEEVFDPPIDAKPYQLGSCYEPIVPREAEEPPKKKKPSSLHRLPEEVPSPPSGGEL